DAFPERATVDECPHVGAVERERREGFACQRLCGEHLVALEHPEPFARPDSDCGVHARNDTRSRFEMRGARAQSRLEVTPQNQHLPIQGGHGMFSQKLIWGVLGLSPLSLTAPACGTATGAAVGAGSGAAVGAGTGYGAGKGALIGLGVGAVGGAIYDVTKHN